MSRRSQAPVRYILPDPKFNNLMLAKFMNVVMKSGKKSEKFYCPTRAIPAAT